MINEWKRRDRVYHGNISIVNDYESRITKKYLLEYKYFSFDPWVRTLVKRNAQKVLDIGCGTGVASLKLMRENIFTVSVDHSMEMLKVVRQKAKITKMTSNCILGDGENLPFQKEAFEGIICSGILLHVSDVEAVIKELVRVLKKGGVLFISETFRIKPFVSYPYHCFVQMIKGALNLLGKKRLTTQTRVISHCELAKIERIFFENGMEYDLKYNVYWPLLCGFLPEVIAYPFIRFLNALNLGKGRGDSFIIIAHKGT